MKRKLRKILSFLFRVDVFNRIAIFLAMALFLILPSVLLYHVHDDNNNLVLVLPSLLILGVLLGTGSLSLYHPQKVPAFFFLEVLFLLATDFDEWIHAAKGILLPSQTQGILISEMVYCLLLFALNGIAMIGTSRRQTRLLLEGTNHDSFLEFVSARDNNKAISKKFFPQRVRFSRLLRLFSGVIHVLVSFLVFLLSFQGDTEESLLLRKTSALSLIFLVLLSFLSHVFPRSYKYVFYYNGFLFSLALFFFCKDLPLSPLFPLSSLLALFLSFLLTLVVEGRTWMGAESDE